MHKIAPGVITSWSGSIAAIPTNWQLCDGSNGTPDLRDRFITGAGTTYAVDDTGGANTHVHTLTTDTHIHPIPTDTAIFKAPAPPAQNGAFTAGAADTATTDAANNVPYYYALAYIQYLGA